MWFGRAKVLKPGRVTLQTNVWPVDSSEVDELERQSGGKTPVGYREFVTAFGEGCLSDTVRIYTPKRILRDTAEWRRRIAEHWFWDPHARFSKRYATEALAVGDTVDGDELAYHPGAHNELVVLPRHRRTIFDAGSTLDEALTWLLFSGTLFEPVGKLYFNGVDPALHEVACLETVLEVHTKPKSSDDVPALLDRLGLHTETAGDRKEHCVWRGAEGELGWSHFDFWTANITIREPLDGRGLLSQMIRNAMTELGFRVEVKKWREEVPVGGYAPFFKDG